MAQSISQEAIGATGLPGATAASRHAGATASGAPTTGTFAVGDFIVDQTGAMYVCTVAGTPGTWVALRNATALQGTAVSATAPTSNQVLQYNGTAWTPTTFSGGAPGTTVQSYITSNVTVAKNTNTNITSISLTAGTWLINAQAEANTAGYNGYSTWLWIGPTSASTTSAYSLGVTAIGSNDSYGSIWVNYSITLATTTTVYLNCRNDATGGVTIVANDVFTNIPNVSGLTAVRTA